MIDARVHLRRVRRRLVVHARVHRRRDQAREVRDGRLGLLLELRLDGPDGKQLQLDGEEPKEADQEARHRGRVEDVVTEPDELVLLGLAQAEQELELVHDLRHERVAHRALDRHQVVVGHADHKAAVWRALGLDVRVGDEAVADAPEMGLHRAPFVPFERTVGRNKEDDEEDHNDNADLDHFH